MEHQHFSKKAWQELKPYAFEIKEVQGYKHLRPSEFVVSNGCVSFPIVMPVTDKLPKDRFKTFMVLRPIRLVNLGPLTGRTLYFFPDDPTLNDLSVCAISGKLTRLNAWKGWKQSFEKDQFDGLIFRKLV